MCARDGVDITKHKNRIVDPSDQNTGQGGCFGSGPGRLNTSNVVYSFKNSAMARSSTSPQYRITLFVEQAGLQGYDSQTLYVAETPPKYNLRYAISCERCSQYFGGRRPSAEHREVTEKFLFELSAASQSSALEGSDSQRSFSVSLHWCEGVIRSDGGSTLEAMRHLAVLLTSHSIG